MRSDDPADWSVAFRDYLDPLEAQYPEHPHKTQVAEFRNRLDGIISFKALDENVILRVVDKFLMQLENQLHEKKVEISFSDVLRKHLAKVGFDPLMGARPMARLVQDSVRKALADELLFGKLKNGGVVSVDYSEAEQKVVFQVEASRKKSTENVEAAV